MRRLYHGALLACALVAASAGVENSYQVGYLGTLIAEPRTPIDPLPKVIGTQCDGKHGAIYADHEDDLPLCKEIRITDYDG